MVVFAIDRVLLHVGQVVVHPAHVPLHVKAQATLIDRARHQRPGGRFFGDGDGAGVLALDRDVEFAQKLDRLQILAAAVDVRHPLAGLARVVEVQHGGHSVHAQTVEVVFVEPEQRRRDQKAAHLMATVVEDRRIPFRMKSLARIGMLEQVGAIEVTEAMLVLRKMRRHPVEQHPDAALVQVIDKGHELIGRAIARGRRKVAGGLVTPRSVERVLGDGHQLDVREAHVERVVGQLPRQFNVAQKFTVLSAP